MASTYWQPAALSQPKVGYPEYPFPNTSSSTAKKKYTPRHVQALKTIARTGPQFSYTNVPWGTWVGPGSYYPGHAAEDQGMAQVNMQNALNQSEAAKAQARLGGGMGYGAGGGAYGGGAPGGGMTGNALYDSFQNAMNNANQANEARYQDALAGYQDRYARNMGYLDNIGAQQQADTNEAYKKQSSVLQQNMINRGLSNSTVADTMQMGNERERLAEQRRLQADLNQQRIGVDSSLSGDTLGFMERKEEQAPSYELLAQLAMQMGQGGVGSGAYVGGPEYQAPWQMGFNIPGAAWGGGGGGYQMPGRGDAGVPMDANGFVNWGAAGGGGRIDPRLAGILSRRARTNERRTNIRGMNADETRAFLARQEAEAVRQNQISENILGGGPVAGRYVHPAPPPDTASDKAWADWLFGVGG